MPQVKPTTKSSLRVEKHPTSGHMPKALPKDAKGFWDIVGLGSSFPPALFRCWLRVCSRSLRRSPLLHDGGKSQQNGLIVAHSNYRLVPCHSQS